MDQGQYFFLFYLGSFDKGHVVQTLWTPSSFSLVLFPPSPPPTPPFLHSPSRHHSLLNFRNDEMLCEGMEACLFYMSLYVQFLAKDVDNEVLKKSSIYFSVSISKNRQTNTKDFNCLPILAQLILHGKGIYFHLGICAYQDFQI